MESSTIQKSNSNGSSPSPFKKIKRVLTGNSLEIDIESTRQAQLPPKDPEQDAKHKKEYEKMLKAYQTKQLQEEKQKEKKEKLQESREEWNIKARKEWEEILKDWSEKTRKSKKIKELCWKGIPPKVRQKAWPLILGDKLHISTDLFTICLNNAQEAREKKQIETEQNKENTVKLIPLDLERTFPVLCFFSEEGPLFAKLQEVLEAYVCYRPDIGYVQGMSFIAAVLLLNLDSYSAFVCMCNLLNSSCFVSFYKMDLDEISIYTNLFLVFFEEKLPLLHKKFTDLEVIPETYILDWILTIFSNALPLDLTIRIWDIFFYEGDYFLIRVCLAILHFFEKQLYELDFDGCMTLLTHIPQEIDFDQFFKSINEIPITEKKYLEVLDSQLKKN